MPYYAKSENSRGHRETVKEHLQKVTVLAREYGDGIGLGDITALAGLVHDIGKYTPTFQDVLMGLQSGVDHAMAGACILESMYGPKCSAYIHSAAEAVNGHHDGLVSVDMLKPEFHAIGAGSSAIRGNAGKAPAIKNREDLRKAWNEFKKDFPDFCPPFPLPVPPADELESMLYTRMIFSCLVDADYTASAMNDDVTYAERAEDLCFDPRALLENLHEYRNGIKRSSTAEQTLNLYRDQVFEQCGKMGDEQEGLFTLTAPTGTGKTLALLHFALRHCLAHGKRRIIIVLPFLTLAEQSADVYSKIVPDVLVDHSQSDLPENARELAARWSSPVIVTTSVRFFEALFSDRPTVCRKLHNIANSVVLFDEAQSLPASLTSATVRAVNELCCRYRTTMVFSTATQPDFGARADLTWNPREILPDHKKMFDALQRVEVEWRIGEETAPETVAEEMSRCSSVCVIVNLRRHAREITECLLERCPDDTVFFISTDLCPAHRSGQIERIRQRLRERLPCRVVATQCLEAGVDLDFHVMYRALAPLEAIIQAAGRCNRNGVETGRVIIFRPMDTRMPYPDAWYNNAAVTVEEMEPPFSIHDPDRIREYYRRLLDGSSDKPELTDAIDSRSFDRTAKEYKLIANTGVRVIVPYRGQEERYTAVARQAREDGITGRLLKESACISVTCFAKNVEIYAEEIPFARRGREGSSDSAVDSHVYLLRPQWEALYSDKMGLQFPQEEQFQFTF